MSNHLSACPPSIHNNNIPFRFRTVSACLVPPAQCQAANSNRDIYDLSSLRNEVKRGGFCCDNLWSDQIYESTYVKNLN